MLLSLITHVSIRLDLKLLTMSKVLSGILSHFLSDIVCVYCKKTTTPKQLLLKPHETIIVNFLLVSLKLVTTVLERIYIPRIFFFVVIVAEGK